MTSFNKKTSFYLYSFLKYDLKASVTVFFVALPLCLGVALASGVPLMSGLIAGVVGGIVLPLISKSELSVSGPAAGLTAICSVAVVELQQTFFLAVVLAGFLQVLLGAFRLGGFTHLIPSAVIKGMLAAIGIILISKQIPSLIGYDEPNFWSNEFFNIITLNHVYSNIQSLFKNISLGAIIISALALSFFVIWEKYFAEKYPLIPASFIVVVLGIGLAQIFNLIGSWLAIEPILFVNIPRKIDLFVPEWGTLFMNGKIWTNAVVIALVASLETLLSVEAIDKLDPYNRITPQNRELVGQGLANTISGFLGGLPITAVIVRSAANAEAGAKTRFSAFAHGIWLLLAVFFATDILNLIPFCVLAVILLRTGYKLARPETFIFLYKQGREQFYPFMVTILAILFTDLLIGVGIGIAYAVYFLVKHTYRAGYSIKVQEKYGQKYYRIELALNVSFLNKKRIIEILDQIPPEAIVNIIGTRSVYIDRDILEVFEKFKSKAQHRNIHLTLTDIPEVKVMEFH